MTTSENPHFRPSTSPFAKSAYAPEFNPWVRGDEMEAALLFRGAIISAYGLIETRLAEVAIRCSKMPVYDGIKEDFPYPMHRRIAYLNTVFSTGPLKAYQGIAKTFFAQFERSAELRHMMAHAYMETCSDLVGWGATFHDYQPTKGGGITYRARRLRLNQLENEAANASRFSRRTRELYWRLHSLNLLPEL